MSLKIEPSKLDSMKLTPLYVLYVYIYSNIICIICMYTYIVISLIVDIHAYVPLPVGATDHTAKHKAGEHLERSDSLASVCCVSSSGW